MGASPELLALILACAPGAAPSTVQAIIDVESGGNYLAIGVNRGGRLARQPSNRVEATAWAQWLLDNGKNFDAGLMQVNSTNWKRLGLNPQNVFDPCTNIRAGTVILTDNYIRAAKNLGPGRAALLEALSAYNTGNRSAGFSNGYVGKVNRAAAKRAGVAPPAVPAPSRSYAASRGRTPIAPSGSGVAPPEAWRGRKVWGMPNAQVATAESPLNPKDSAE